MHHWPRSTLGVALLTLLSLVHPLAAQLAPPSTGGAAALAQELKQLGHYRRVLMIGAHPDDEDTELLTILVRGMGAEAAYLSLNRGEGGQNLIGGELGEALGVLRTEELLAARRLDGARQYFTRAYDFGFSKSLDETWTHWPRDSILKDVVRIVRRFRPQVIVSVFSGTPRDGHGQHQAAGWAAMEAFRAAGDSSRFPELRQEGLAPWTPLKLYRSSRFDSAATTLTLQGGAVDEVSGQTYHQIAMASRSRHRSQDMGRLQEIGASPVRVALIEDRTGRGAGSLFAGIDTSLAAIPVDAGSMHPTAVLLTRIAAEIDSVRSGAARDTVALLTRALKQASEWQAPELADQATHLVRALTAVTGVLVDARTSDDRVVPGQQLTAVAQIFNGGRHQLTACRGPGGAVHCARLEPGTLISDSFRVAVEAAAPISPYFLRRPRVGDLYDWTGVPPTALGAPFEDEGDHEVRSVEFVLSGDRGESFTIARELTFRYNDPSLGEVRRPLMVVPRVGVRLDPPAEVWAAGDTRPHELTVTLAHGAGDPTAGRVELIVPRGWVQVPAQRFRLDGEEQRATVRFLVRAPAGVRSGTATIRAEAVDSAGNRYGAGLVEVDYPHVRPRAFARPAVATISVAPLALPKLTRVGYVRGAADAVPEALRSIGVPLELLDAQMLDHGDLGRYDAIVIGPRAYETDRALVTHNARILDYARAGGLVIVQYQQYPFVKGGHAPYPLTIATPHDRVTEEDAPVRTLRDDPVLRSPNAIGAGDWRGWVQERGLYFAHSWDPRYRTVLEMHDSGESPHEGGLLIAPLGRGTYVYTGLAFFRELPAGVPGAYRLFANLLALRRGSLP